MSQTIQRVNVGSAVVDILSDDTCFIGLGAVNIGGRAVRSDRLPIRPFTQTFAGQELHRLDVLGVDESAGETRIKLRATFRPMPIKLMRDHSLDPIHCLGDWDKPVVDGDGRLDIVLRPAEDKFGDVNFVGFSYGYEYESDTTPIFYIYDMATWELDGDVSGLSVISQSACSDPTVTFDSPDTAWSTEGILHFLAEFGNVNPVMTHNLPRWASHQSFDYQYRADGTLIGVFDHVDLIRSVVQRDAGKGELKHFDKHLFDQASSYKTSPKAILLNEEQRSDAGQKNLWTRVIDSVHDRARGEFGLAEEPLLPFIHCNHWNDFKILDYLEDLLPVAADLGFEQVFIDNVNKSAMSEKVPSEKYHLNMCCGDEYEVAPSLGGPEALKTVVDAFNARGIRAMAWTNNDQCWTSRIFPVFSDKHQDWWVLYEDARTRYGGAYTNAFIILDFKKEAPRKYWSDSMTRIREETGLSCYLFDSFYNLGFMPINYENVSPSTQWREIVQEFKHLQDAGVHFTIESLGPFGLPFHGIPASYAKPENIFAAYKVYAQIGYTTIPSGTAQSVDDADGVYRFFAHMASPLFTLYTDGKRLDALWGDRHKQALADYNRSRPYMHTRFLQDDGDAVVWHDGARKHLTVFNFVDRDVALPGAVRNITTGEDVPAAESYSLKAGNTYWALGDPLCEQIGDAKR